MTHTEKFRPLGHEGEIYAAGKGLHCGKPQHVAIKILASYTEEQIITSDPSQVLQIREAKKALKESGGSEAPDNPLSSITGVV